MSGCSELHRVGAYQQGKSRHEGAAAGYAPLTAAVRLVRLTHYTDSGVGHGDTAAPVPRVAPGDHVRITHRALALAAVSLLVASTAAPASAAPRHTVLDPASANAVYNYVISIYEDLFHRAPEWSGEVGWSTALISGTPRIAVANAITSSEEFRTGLIDDAYDTYLGRGPDAGGLQSWLGGMSAGMTVEQLDSGFIASPEYWATNGGTSADWVRALYRDVLGRDAGSSEVTGWVAALDRGATRTQVSLGFLLSTEYLTTVVDGYYQRFLRRSIEPGQGTWVAAIQNGARDEQIIGGIVASDEYWNNESTRPWVGSISLSPNQDTSLYLGWGQTYTVQAYQPDGTLIGDATDEATITWDGQPCLHGLCQPTAVGPHEIHAQHRGLNAWVTLTVLPLA